MKKTNFLLWFILSFVLSACSHSNNVNSAEIPSSPPTKQIFLYGETHDVEKILNKELELWQEYYENDSMRHLFIEHPYYTAEFLNLYMQSDSDEILGEIYDDWVGTAAHSPSVKKFYEEIKDKYPETIFHGTDVGHQNDTTGKRYLTYLEDNSLSHTEKYTLAKENIEQGEYYYSNKDDAYRENKMTENFIRAFDILNDESVMGIYGSAHTDLYAMDYMTNSVPSMANQLSKYYKDIIYSESLSWLAKDIDPLRIDIFTINDKEYEASYYGKEDVTGFKEYKYFEYWRVENAYDDFKDMKKNRDYLPFDNYPMLIFEGQVFILDITTTDNAVIRKFYRSDGGKWKGQPATQEFLIN